MSQQINCRLCSPRLIMRAARSIPHVLLLLLAFVTTAAAPLKLGFIDPVSNSSLHRRCASDAAVAGFANLSVVSATSPGVITGGTSMAGINSIFSMRKTATSFCDGALSDPSRACGLFLHAQQAHRELRASDVDLVDKSNTPLLLRTVPSSAPNSTQWREPFWSSAGAASRASSPKALSTRLSTSRGRQFAWHRHHRHLSRARHPSNQLRAVAASAGARIDRALERGIIVSLTRTIDQMKIQSITLAVFTTSSTSGSGCIRRTLQLCWVAPSFGHCTVIFTCAQLARSLRPEPEPETEPGAFRKHR